MENRTKSKRLDTVKEHRKALIYVLVLLFLTLLFHLFKSNRAVMNFMTDYVAHPIRRVIAWFCGFTMWSVAEWLLIAAALFVLAFLVYVIIDLIRNRKRFFSVLYKSILYTAAIVLTISTLMTLLWNVNYYADSFQQKSGIYAEESSVADLHRTTVYFAQMASDASTKVARDKDGNYAEDIDTMFDLSPTLFSGIEAEFPFLKGIELRTKKVFFSRAMSYANTTGVAFPFTGEANVNIDQTTAWIPATIAHEIAHQRKVASEQEANFVAILACERSENEAFIYSGYLLAYNYLASALSREDPEAYKQVYDSLSDEMKRDLSQNREYWRQFQGKISEISDSLYDNYLKEQGQELGTKSYGAVVDLLIAYYGQP